MFELMASMWVAAMMGVGQPEEGRPAQTMQIMVEFQLIEADLDAKWFDPQRDSDEPANIALEPGGVINLHSGARARMGGDWQAFFTVERNASIGAGLWRYTIDGVNEDLDDGPFSIITSPRIIVLDRQIGRISVGQAVEYLEPAEEQGLFRVVKEAITEGVTISVTPRLLESGSILLEPMTVELREVVDRGDVEGLSIPGIGKPVIETTKREVTALIGAGQTVVVPIAHREFDQRPLLLLVHPSVMTEQPVNDRIKPDEADEPGEAPDSPG